MQSRGTLSLSLVDHLISLLFYFVQRAEAVLIQEFHKRPLERYSFLTHEEWSELWDVMT